MTSDRSFFDILGHLAIRKESYVFDYTVSNIKLPQNYLDLFTIAVGWGMSAKCILLAANIFDFMVSKSNNE